MNGSGRVSSKGIDSNMAARVISLSDVAKMISNGTVDTMFVPEKQQDRTHVLFHPSKEQTSLGVLAHSFQTWYNMV